MEQGSRDEKGAHFSESICIALTLRTMIIFHIPKM